MSWLAALVIATMLATCAFMVVRITLFLLTEGQWYDRFYCIRQPVAALSVNVFWCLYNFWLLLTMFYFNRPEEIRPGVSVSADVKVYV